MENLPDEKLAGKLAGLAKLAEDQNLHAHRYSKTCPIHKTNLVCPRCYAGEVGSVRSKAKAASSRRNGKLGGRPRKKKLAA